MIVSHFIWRRDLIIFNDFLQQATCSGVSHSLFWALELHSLYDNNWTIMSSCPYLAAMCNGVFLEVELWMLGSHLSLAMRYRTMLTSSHRHARWSRPSPFSLSGIFWAVSPFLLGMLVLHLLSRRSLMMFSDFIWHAMCSGVFKYIFWTLGSHLSLMMRYATISTSSHLHAMWSR